MSLVKTKEEITEVLLTLAIIKFVTACQRDWVICSVSRHVKVKRIESSLAFPSSQGWYIKGNWHSFLAEPVETHFMWNLSYKPSILANLELFFFYINFLVSLGTIHILRKHIFRVFQPTHPHYKQNNAKMALIT